MKHIALSYQHLLSRRIAMGVLLALFSCSMLTLAGQEKSVNAASVQQQKSAITAHETIQQVTDKLVKAINQSKASFKQDPDSFYKVVEGVMSPAINFKKITRGVMGKKYYNAASGAQRERFIDTFKEALIQTYAKGLIEFDNQKIAVVPPTTDTTGKKKVVVRQKIYGADAVYPLSYSMSLNKDGKWQLYNVTINGVNLGMTFRNQFAQAMKDHRGDIDKVIANWSVKAAASASS